MQDLRAIAECCPRLTSLNISSCRSLDPAALSILLPSGCTNDSPTALTASARQSLPTLIAPDSQEAVMLQEVGLVAGQQGCALPLLTSLDVSYCSLPPEMVCSLLQHGCRFQVGCMHATRSCCARHRVRCRCVWWAVGNTVARICTLPSCEVCMNAHCQAVS